MNRTYKSQVDPAVAPPNDSIPNKSNFWILFYVFALVFIQGLVVNHITVLLPILKDAFGLSDRAIGTTASFAFAGGLPALFLSGYVTEWVRPKLSGVIAVVLMGAGCLVMGFASSHIGVIIGIMILHFGWNWILAVHSAVIADFFPASRQRLFFLVMATLAVGAMIGPLVIGNALSRVEAAAWGKVYIWLGIALWSLLALLLLVCGRRIGPLSFKARRASDNEHVVSATSVESSAHWISNLLASGVFNRTALYLLGLIVILDNLATMNILAWIGVLANNRFAAGPEAIGYLSSIMAFGILVGRIFMASFVSGKVSDRKLLGYSYGTAMVCFMAMLIAPSMAVLYVLYFIMAFFASVQSATTYAIGADKLKERAAVGIPIADGIGAIGSLAAPLIMGYMADQLGLSRALWLIPLFGFALMFVSLSWEWFDQWKDKE